MFEVPGKEIGKLAERLVEGVPGFAWAAILLNILVPFAFPNVPHEWVPIWAFSLAWAGDTFGHYADDWLYDPIWGPHRRMFPRKLYNVRKELAGYWEVPVTGILAKATHLSKGTEIWEKRVKLWLEFSKASRSFMFLSAAALLRFAGPWILLLIFGLLVLLFMRMSEPWTGLKYWLSGAALIGLIFQWAVPTLPGWDRVGSVPDRLVLLLALILLVSSGLYLGLRILHIIRLYEEAKTIVPEKRDGLFCVGQRVIPVNRVLLRSTLNGDDDAIRKAEEFVQSRALLHVELRVEYESLKNCQGLACELDVHDRELEKLKAVVWAEEPTRVPRLGFGEWCQATPNLVINFVSTSGDDLSNITKRLNITL